MALKPNINDREKDKFLQTTSDKTAVRTVLYDEVGNGISVNDDGQLHVVLRGAVDECNSTATPLGIGGVFTGTACDMLDYGIIFVSVFADEASATDGLSIQQSSDGTNWDNSDEYTVPASTGKTFSFQPAMKYMRVVYTNGATAQTVFRLQTVLKKTNSLPSSHRISDAIIDDDDATLQKSVLTGKNASGNFINFGATNGGNFKCSLEELENDVSVNSNSQLKTTTFDSSGNEGQKIIGIDYLAGNSGIDRATETLQIITYEHHEIHAGSHFYICSFETLDDGDSADFAVTTPNTAKWAHMTFQVEGTSQTEFYIYEGSAVTGGTATTPLNNDRNSANTSDLTIAKNPTVNTLGTMIYSQSKGLVGATPSKADSEGVVTREREIILKQNTTYIFRITSRQDDNIVSYCGEWYEHTNKN